MIVEKTAIAKPVMVVDDEPDIVAVLKRGIEREGFEVHAFSSPEEALANFKPNAYSLLVTDIRMPNLNGLELYSKISKIDPKLRVGFLTAYEMHDYEFRRAHPEASNIAFVMRKPVSILALLNRIRAVLEQEGAEQNGIYLSLRDDKRKDKRAE